MKTIVFDMDGTIVEEVGFLRKHAPKFLKEKYGLHVTEVNPSGYTVSEIYDLEKHLDEIGCADASAVSQKISQDFWNSYFVRYCKSPIKANVKEIIDSFKNKGYSIHIVSMRAKKTNETESVFDAIIRRIIIPLLTKRQLRKSHVKFDILELPSSLEQKIDYIRAVNPQYVFEDQVSIINAAADCTSTNAKVICVNNPYNSTVAFASKVLRIDDFKSKQLQTEIQNILSNKKKAESKSFFAKPFYRIVRFIGKPIVNILYKPFVFGLNKIPKNNSIAFIGNHRKKDDPIIITSLTTQIIHWAALKRMFIGKEDLFSNTHNQWRRNISSEFLKYMGAVPIARPDDPEYHTINFKAIHFLLKQLNNEQDSIGFFPEGTLNRNYQNHNILPIKTTHIFKSISITKCYLLPFSIVWIPKNKTIRNKVVVIFDYPINTENRSEEELTRMWITAVEKNIQKANECINYLMKVDAEDISKFNKQRKVKIKFQELKN